MKQQVNLHQNIVGCSTSINPESPIINVNSNGVLLVEEGGVHNYHEMIFVVLLHGLMH